jgi:transcriptional regulator with XRE-family HTH domain
MNIGAELRTARERAGMTQAELAAATGTSQATISNYESGRKAPAIDTFARLLAETGSRLAVETFPPAALEPSRAQRKRTARQLAEVLALAEALPTRHDPELTFPRLGKRAA